MLTRKQRMERTIIGAVVLGALLILGIKAGSVTYTPEREIDTHLSGDKAYCPGVACTEETDTCCDESLK